MTYPRQYDFDSEYEYSISDSAENPFKTKNNNEFTYVKAPEFVEPIEYFKHLEEPTTTCAGTY